MVDAGERRVPWFKFYSGDWRADPGLRRCGFAARGLWADILSLMHEAQPYGELRISGDVPSTRDIARVLGGTEAEVRRLLAELEAANVFSRGDDGAIYSRRMKRDHERSIFDRDNGRCGGNPRIKPPVQGPVNPPVNPPVKGAVDGGDKAQSPETRVHNTGSLRSPDAPAAADTSLLDRTQRCDPRKAVWTEGVATVRRLTGKPEGSAKQLIGKLLKEARDDCAGLLAALRECPDSGDPIAWLSAAAKQRGAPRANATEEMREQWALGSGVIDSSFMDDETTTQRRLLA
jgi:hypothetical protein